jgi:hypothetical protein
MNGRSVLSLVGVTSLAAAVYGFVIRPWMLGWGSTVEERTRPLPGDEIEPGGRVRHHSRDDDPRAGCGRLAMVDPDGPGPGRVLHA